MARPRKPTAMLRLVGALDKNPQRGRARAGEPIPDGAIGDPPAALSPTEQLAWREIAGICHVGTTCKADRISLEVLARLLAEYRAAPLTFPNARLLRLGVLLSQFGLTPSDRSRLNFALADKPPNRFAALAARARHGAR